MASSSGWGAQDSHLLSTINSLVQLTLPKAFMAKGSAPPALIIAMGVSGSGKSTLGQNLASALGVPFYDGDSLHPQSNVEKMSKGIPLTDADREPWLALIRSTADRICENKEADGSSTGEIKGVVIACSALKRYYRDILRGHTPKSHQPPPATDLPKDHPIAEHTGIEIQSDQELAKDEEKELERAASRELRTFFVFINGPREVLQDRMKQRQNHFMKVEMLDSQLATLENPTGEDGVVVVQLAESPDKQVRDAVDGLKKLGFPDQRSELPSDGVNPNLPPVDEPTALLRPTTQEANTVDPLSS